MSQPATNVTIFDTTLRDGEQSPGATLSAAEKLEIARHLAGMGVDVIEAGFPAASDGDFESVRAIAAEVRGSVICGLARCVRGDIDRAAEAVKGAAKPRIHTFISSSDVQIEHQLRSDRPTVLKRARELVGHARSLVEDVEFSPMDATRTEPGFLAELVAAAVEQGATTINLPDTVGYATPEGYAEMFRRLMNNLPMLAERGIVLSTHCHNDLGLAVANSLAAVSAGARQVECTVNGIGERAGNAALEEVVMALRVRPDAFTVGTRIETKKLYPASRMVSTMTGLAVQRNKAIVGQNAFSHEAGIHQDGVLKHRETYEIMDPTSVGIPKSSLVLGKHSGRAAFRDRINTLGFSLTDEQVEATFARFKTLADKKKEVYDEDLEALIDEQLEVTRGLWQLKDLQVVSGTNSIPTATVTLTDSTGETLQDAGVGDGPVDAIYSTLQRLTGVQASLKTYRIRAVTRGKEALGEVQVELEHGGAKVNGRGLSTDILEASALAYLAALNRLRGIGDRQRRVSQYDGV